MTEQQYYRLINAAELQGLTFTADVWYMLYLYDYPNAPRKCTSPTPSK